MLGVGETGGRGPKMQTSRYRESRGCAVQRGDCSQRCRIADLRSVKEVDLERRPSQEKQFFKL